MNPTIAPDFAERRWIYWLTDIWDHRPCFICRELGLCDHREAEVDKAAYGAKIRPELPNH